MASMHACTPRWYVAVALTAMALVLSCALLISYVGNGQDIALIRNSLVYETRDSEATFRAAPTAPPPLITAPAWRDAAAAAGALNAQSSDFERALALVRHLDQPGYPRGGMLALPSLDTYRAMRDSGRGYCADYTQVFLALAEAAGLSAREWGISFNGYSGAGHALVEIYAREIHDWIMLDVFNGLYVSDEAHRPLSLPALRARLVRGERAGLNVEVVADIMPFASLSLALHYLERGMPRAYLWINPQAAGQPQALLDELSRHSRALAQLFAIASGRAPRMVLMPAPTQRAALLELRLLRLACVTALISSVLLVVLLWRRYRSRRVVAAA
jgi:hypothetical protein